MTGLHLLHQRRRRRRAAPPPFSRATAPATARAPAPPARRAPSSRPPPTRRCVDSLAAPGLAGGACLGDRGESPAHVDSALVESELRSAIAIAPWGDGARVVVVGVGAPCGARRGGRRGADLLLQFVVGAGGARRPNEKENRLARSRRGRAGRGARADAGRAEPDGRAADPAATGLAREPTMAKDASGRARARPPLFDPDKGFVLPSPISPCAPAAAPPIPFARFAQRLRRAASAASASARRGRARLHHRARPVAWGCRPRRLAASGSLGRLRRRLRQAAAGAGPRRRRGGGGAAAAAGSDARRPSITRSSSAERRRALAQRASLSCS